MLDGRVVLITGAGSGIGRATALRAARDGADIAAIDLEQAGLDSLVEEVRALGRRAAAERVDVADEDALGRAFAALIDELGSLHAVFANAGTLTRRTALTDLSLDEWNRVLAVDLTGVMLTFRAAVPYLSASGGALLACGSSLGVRPGTLLLPYVAAKAAVHAIARSLALELAPLGIRVNVVAPGLTDTPMTRGMDGHIETGLQSVPLGQLVAIDDVAAMAVHLMSDEARSITGAVYLVDAGRTAM